jgi:hypothetical protein
VLAALPRKLLFSRFRILKFWVFCEVIIDEFAKSHHPRPDGSGS